MSIRVPWSSPLLAVVFACLACAGAQPPAPRPVPVRPAPPPIPRPAQGRTLPDDGLDHVAATLTEKRWCEGALCEVVSEVGGTPRQVRDGVRVGLALACRDPADPGVGEPLRAAARGDWSLAELTGLSFDGGQVNVFAIRPDDDRERRVLDGVRRQLVACLEGGRCDLQVPDALRRALQDPAGRARPAEVDAEGHLVARSTGELAWHVGHSEARGGWLVVTEHRAPDGEGWCDWLDVYPATPLDVR